jgi:hypothetical protein
MFLLTRNVRGSSAGLEPGLGHIFQRTNLATSDTTRSGVLRDLNQTSEVGARTRMDGGR